MPTYYAAPNPLAAAAAVNGVGFAHPFFTSTSNQISPQGGFYPVSYSVGIATAAVDGSVNDEDTKAFLVRMLVAGFDRPGVNKYCFNVREGQKDVISKAMWRRARFENRGNYGMHEWNSAHSRRSYEMDVLEDAIEFVTGPTITQKVAHGTHVVEKKDGTPVILPRNICHHTPATTYAMYKQHRHNLPQLSHAQFSLLIAIACPGHTSNVAALDESYRHNGASVVPTPRPKRGCFLRST
eukprot:gene23772-30037_t